jgi:Na+-driven multidrug efflux pump
MSIPYLRIRSLSFIPQLVAFVGFSAFRGTMDLKSCVRISVVSSALNLILNPLLVHVFQFGIAGSGIAALTCDWITALSYVTLMAERKLLLWRKLLEPPSWKQVLPLLKGSALLLRSISMIITQLMVARKIQSLDDSGVAPAAFALAMQTFQMGGVILFALGTATQTLYPNAIASCPLHDKQEYTRSLIRRLMRRGFGIGTVVSLVQMLFAPGLLRSSPLIQVREAALFPIVVVIAFQGINGLVSVGEGIIIGDGKFTRASMNLAVATLGYIACLQLSPRSMGINGVFLSLVLFMVLRLIGVLVYLPSAINGGYDDDTDEKELDSSPA